MFHLFSGNNLFKSFSVFSTFFPVDTHIHRLAWRWGLSTGKNVEKTEKDLKRLFPENKWNKLHLQIIFYGREYCPARGHNLEVCIICSKYRRKEGFK